MSKKHKFGTTAIHAGQTTDPTTGAILTPIYQTSTFVQPSPGEFIEDYDYSRAANPTRRALEIALAEVEGAKHGISYSSGMASIDATLHLLNTGDHVVLCDDVYGGTFRLFDKVFKQLGIEFTMVDMTDAEATKAAVKANTKLFFIETPTNPLLKIVDLNEIIAIGKDSGALVVVDNTFATPYLQRPLDLGADIITHSTTKYFGGHADLVGGVLMVNNDDLAEKLKFLQKSIGGVPGIFDCFLTLRSLKTLHVRMDRHCFNARKIAEHFESHPKLEKVIYPGLPSHPQHEIAKKQMLDFGGMISVIVKGGLDKTKTVLEKLEVFTLAESLGDVISLANHPALMTHASIPPDLREAIGIGDGLIRLSVGIEDVDDLIADLEQALG